MGSSHILARRGQFDDLPVALAIAKLLVFKPIKTIEISLIT